MGGLTLSGVEALMMGTLSQMWFVASGVFTMMVINSTKGGLRRYEKTVVYYEALWTSMPVVILLIIAVPSMCLLYVHEQESLSGLSVKCIGHQWYWSYEYGDLTKVVLDSFMTPTEALEMGGLRYLEVDNRAVVPVDTCIQWLMTSEDVIHAWALPFMGIKVDATPGRLNVINLALNSVGVLYGQCSELCGVNHSLMPIVVEVTTPVLLVEWLSSLN